MALLKQARRRGMATGTNKTDAAAAGFDLALPAHYSLVDVLHFHGRDTESVAEEVSAARIRKGILLADMPAVIDIAFEENGDGRPAVAHCAVAVDVDGTPTAAMQAQARAVADSILGLRLDPAAFAAFAAGDPVFGPLTVRQRGLRVVQSPSVFEALTWAIMGQQINVAFAVSLRRTFILQAGRRHSSGLWCYPSAADAAKIDMEALTTRQFSRSKAETLLRLATLVANGELDLDTGPDNPLEAISAALLKVKGIGPWTVNYGMLRGYAHADCSLHGDVAVRSAIQKLFGGDERPDIAAAEQFLQRYSPHRTMVAAHLWASLSARGGY
jgi:DNA-3-methyladenine glycosylase II